MNAGAGQEENVVCDYIQESVNVGSDTRFTTPIKMERNEVYGVSGVADDVSETGGDVQVEMKQNCLYGVLPDFVDTSQYENVIMQ